MAMVMVVRALASELKALVMVALDLVMELAALELEALEMGSALVRFQSDMWSSCSLCKEYLHHSRISCRKKFVSQRRDNRGSEHRRDSNGLDFLAPCAVHLVLVQESWENPCRVQIAA